jgi:sigma-B regulation protein RsbU (phosphoserine phosphatase)
VPLRDDDLLVAFSDGVTETVNNDGSEFGEERLLDCILSHRTLAPDDLLNRVFAEVRDFCAGAPQSDDLTALVVRYSGRGGFDLEPAR